MMAICERGTSKEFLPNNDKHRRCATLVIRLANHTGVSLRFTTERGLNKSCDLPISEGQVTTSPPKASKYSSRAPATFSSLSLGFSLHPQAIQVNKSVSSIFTCPAHEIPSVQLLVVLVRLASVYMGMQQFIGTMI